MSGREIKNRESGRGAFLKVPLALEILCLLTLLLVLTGGQVYRIQRNGFEKFELDNYRKAMELITETGVQQIRLESRRAVQRGSSVDLEDLKDRIGGIKLDPDMVQVNGERLWFTEREIDLRDSSLYFQYLILRGDGETLLIDGYSGLMKQLGADDAQALYGWEAFRKGEQVSWNAAESEEETQSMVYCLADVIPAEGPVRFGDNTVLFNHAGAGIGLVCRVNTSAIHQGCSLRAMKITLMSFGTIWGVVLLLCLRVDVFMKLLRIMQRIMRRFRNGEDDALDEKSRAIFLPDRTRPREEMTDLAESFYVMAGSLRQYRDSVESIRETFEPFVPSVLYALFDTEDVLKVAPGDESVVRGSSLELQFVYSEAEEPAAAPVSGEALLPAENTAASAGKRIPFIAAEIVEGKGGLLISLGMYGLTAVFRDQTCPGEVLELILGLKQKESSLKDIIWKTDTGTFCVRIIGTPDRMAFTLDKVAD